MLRVGRDDGEDALHRLVQCAEHLGWEEVRKEDGTQLSPPCQQGKGQEVGVVGPGGVGRPLLPGTEC